MQLKSSCGAKKNIGYEIDKAAEIEKKAPYSGSFAG